MISVRCTIYLISIVIGFSGCITKQTVQPNEDPSDSKISEMSETTRTNSDGGVDVIMDSGISNINEGNVIEDDMPSTDMPSTDMPSTDMPSTDMPSTNMTVIDQGLPSDMSTEDPNGVIDSSVRCVNACSDVVDCLGDTCDVSPLNNYAQCVNACTTGVISLDDIESVRCDTLKTWVCEGPFAGDCGCQFNDCEQSCQNVVQCIDPICDSEVLTLEDCIDYCEESPSSFDNLGLNSVACDDVQNGLCPQFSDVCGGCPQRDPNTFNLGAPCERDADCQAGELRPYCISATSPEEDNNIAWSGGYCTGLECGVGDCGPNGVCIPINEMGQTACFSLCGEEQPDCRMGYQCENLGVRNLLACLPF